jgi:protoporphyrinogen oxidase
MKKEIIILGGGLSGLSAGYYLSLLNKDLIVFEESNQVGGLAKTIEYGGFRFDLGGHRFFTTNKEIEKLVKDLLGDELLIVFRRSKIYLKGKYFDYPLNPKNIIDGLGVKEVLKAFFDFLYEKCKINRNIEAVSLEDWVISRFGKGLYELFFKEYSEKVWGIPCNRISAEWISQRIQGLSWKSLIKSALFKHSDNIPTLIDKFLYPSHGIGRIADKLAANIIKAGNKINLNCKVEKIFWEGDRIKGVYVKEGEVYYYVEGEMFISTIPITSLIKSLFPKPPDDILKISSYLKYRHLFLVVIFLNKPKATNYTWCYFPEKEIPFGRIHEPTNWSINMAPEKKTLIVAEYFCNEEDEIWQLSEGQLIENTILYLEKVGIIKRIEILDGKVIRVPMAYPFFDIDYKKYYSKIIDYLSRFKNLFLAGRTGMFKYYNMDKAIESGIQAAKNSLINKV